MSNMSPLKHLAGLLAIGTLWAVIFIILIMVITLCIHIVFSVL